MKTSPASVLRFLLPPTALGLAGLLVWKLHSLDYLPLLQNPAFRPLTLFFSGFLLLLALALPWCLEPAGSPAGLAGDLARFLVMLAPAAAFFLLPDPTQSAKILSDRAWMLQNLTGQTSFMGRKNQEAIAYVQGLLPQLPPGEPVDLDLDVLASLASRPESRALFAEVSFRTRAQYQPSSKEGRWKMARLLMVCCVADTRPIVLEARGSAPEIRENDWVEATGKLGVEDGIPVLLATEAARIDPEEDLFLYGP
jgi:hypothetical protein